MKMANISGLNYNNTTTTTEPINTQQNSHFQWYTYLELCILGVLSVIGVTGNLLVIKTAVRVRSQFARQIMSLFLCLAITDILMCSVRIPLLFYNRLHWSWDQGNTVCKIWLISLAILGVALWDNLLVSGQRLMIMTSFPKYRRYFTLHVLVGCVLTIWFTQLGINISLSMGFEITLTYNDDSTCVVRNPTDVLREVVRASLLVLLGVVPLIIASVCHVMIVYKITAAGLTRLERIDDTWSYKKIVRTAVMRVVIINCCWLPFLLANIADSEFRRIPMSVHRYLDYLMCLQSVISPFITIQDSDFSDTTNRKNFSHRLGSHAFQSSLRRSCRIAISHHIITSGDMRTNRQTE